MNTLDTMTSLPWIDWDAAARTGRRLVPPGPRASRAERDQLVAELRADARRSAEVIVDTTQLPQAGQARELVVDRAGIVRANVLTARRMLAAATDPRPDGAAAKTAGYARGVSIGTVLGMLGSRILGQYDPFGEEPTLYLVAPSIMAVEQQLKVPAADFRMWVVLHEQTHRVQFANATWLPGYLSERARALAEAEDEAFWHDLPARLEQIRADRRENRPASMRVLNALSSPATVAAMSEVNAAMSLLEGHADVMMDRSGRQLIGSVSTIRAKFQGRRSPSGLPALLNKLMGMDAKLAQYAEGAEFCRQVMATGGVGLLNEAFSEAGAMPSMQELLHPDQWCERIAGNG